MNLSRYLHVLKKKKTLETAVETVQEPIDSATKTSDDTEVAQMSETRSLPASTSSDNVIVADRVKVSIDEAVYESTDIGTVQKIISIVRYIVASGGATLPGIENWQFSHSGPYKY